MDIKQELRTDELQHWKYIKKIPTGSGYRYFYSWDEWRAYLADPTAELQTAGKKAASDIKSTFSKAASGARSVASNVQRGSTTYKQRVQSYANRIRANVNQPKEYYSRKADQGMAFIRRLTSKGIDAARTFGSEAARKAQDTAKEVEKKANEGAEWIDKQLHPPRKEQPKAERMKTATNTHKYVGKVEINGKMRYFYSQEELNAYNRRQKYQDEEPDFMKGFKRSEEPFTREEDSLMVNPKFDPEDRDTDYEYNCAECTAIYELRRRGYDVESNGVSGRPNSDSVLIRLKEQYDALKFNSRSRFDTMFENPNVQSVPKTKTPEETYKAIEAEIKKNPPNSRGDLSIKWAEGGGHSVVWEMDSDKNITIVDCQLSGSSSRMTYNLKNICQAVDNSDDDPNYRACVTRTDNLKLKKDITKICKNSNSTYETRPVPNGERKMQASYHHIYSVSDTSRKTLNKGTFEFSDEFKQAYPVLSEGVDNSDPDRKRRS